MRTNRIKAPFYVVSLVPFVLCSFIVLAQEPEPEMVFVRAGKFSMGSNLGVKDESPVHDVYLDDFFIGKFEITQEQWKWIMADDTNKRFFEGCGICPVERVSWFSWTIIIKFTERIREFIDNEVTILPVAVYLTCFSIYRL